MTIDLASKCQGTSFHVLDMLVLNARSMITECSVDNIDSQMYNTSLAGKLTHLLEVVF